jgi:preprotein translocase subunit SecG
MISVLTGLHVLICIGLIIVVLLQTGRGTGMASVFGGGGGGSLMGGKGFGGVLAKATAGLAILFMLTSITLSLIPRGGRRESVIGGGAPQPAGRTQTERAVPGEAGPEQPPAEQAPAGGEAGETSTGE